MGKRSTFERKPRDFYPTPLESVAPLIPHLPPRPVTYVEPCAGDGALILGLAKTAPQVTCVGAFDLSPQAPWIERGNALQCPLCVGEMFITNPPWAWSILNPLITHLSALAPTWLILNADQMHNKRVGPHLKRCVKIVSIGRVKWEPDSKGTGMENAAWYCFDARHQGDTVFVGR